MPLMPFLTMIFQIILNNLVVNGVLLFMMMLQYLELKYAKKNADSFYQNIPHINNCINIIALHGQVCTTCDIDHININFLRNKGIDYLALGHIHSYTSFSIEKGGVACYPGCLEGRGFDECGEKGFVLLNVNNHKACHEFIPFCCRQLHKISVDITGLTKNSEIGEKMRTAAQKIGTNDMVEFVLTGYSDPTANISISYLYNLIKDKFFFCKVKNESHMLINPDDYKHDISLKGEFIRLVLSSNASDEEKSAMIRAGIQALAGEEIVL